MVRRFDELVLVAAIDLDAADGRGAVNEAGELRASWTLPGHPGFGVSARPGGPRRGSESMNRAARLLLQLALTAALVAAVWFGAPAVVGERPPAGLLGMLGGMGLAFVIVNAMRPGPRKPSGGGD
jgi:hypothetical protein